MQIYEQMVSELISDAYTIGTSNSEFMRYKNYIKTSRNSGFPIICTLTDLSESEQLCRAAKLLITLFGVWPKADIPKNLILKSETKLYKDAKFLILSSLNNHSELESRQNNNFRY